MFFPKPGAHCFQEIPQCVVPPLKKRFRAICMYVAPAAPLSRVLTTSPLLKMSLSSTKMLVPASFTAQPIECDHAVLRPRAPWPCTDSRQKYELNRIRHRRRNPPSVSGRNRTMSLALLRT